MSKHTTLDQMKMLAQRVKKELNASGLSVPTKLSELVNDSGYQTEEEVLALIADADHMKRKIVVSLDDIDVTAKDADKFIYMLKIPQTNEETGDDESYYEEYMVVGGKLDIVGNSKIDLTDYVKKTDVATDAEATEMLNDVFGVITPEVPSEPDEGSGENDGRDS